MLIFLFVFLNLVLALIESFQRGARVGAYIFCALRANLQKKKQIISKEGQGGGSQNLPNIDFRPPPILEKSCIRACTSLSLIPEFSGMARNDKCPTIR